MMSKNFKFLIIFVFILFLGVGYAVVSSVGLSIAGTTTSASEELDVYFTGEKSVSNSSKGSANVVANSRSATFTADDLTLGESITFSYVVENNESDVYADVTLTTSGNTDYYTAVVNSGTTSFTLSPQSTKNITVLVTMTKTPIDSSDETANFTINMNAVPRNYEGIDKDDPSDFGDPF